MDKDGRNYLVGVLVLQDYPASVGKEVRVNKLHRTLYKKAITLIRRLTMRNKSSIHFIMIISMIFVLMISPFTAGASHAWGDYHWERSENPVNLSVIDNMTPDWDDNLDLAISDWDKSSVLNLMEEAGDDGSRARRRCGTVKGKIVACNYEYGNNGWLGVAQIWVKGSHITQGTAKMNDTYFASPSYDETARSHVACQEIGHLFGLDHQDESGADLNTCMDYDFYLSNAHPNQHDYAMLEIIYEHLDSGSGGGKPGGGPPGGGGPNGFYNANVHAQENWGEKLSESASGHAALFVRDFGNGFKILTFVFWAE